MIMQGKWKQNSEGTHHRQRAPLTSRKAMSMRASLQARSRTHPKSEWRIHFHVLAVPYLQKAEHQSGSTLATVLISENHEWIAMLFWWTVRFQRRDPSVSASFRLPSHAGDLPCEVFSFNRIQGTLLFAHFYSQFYRNWAKSLTNLHRVGQHFPKPKNITHLWLNDSFLELFI